MLWGGGGVGGLKLCCGGGGGCMVSCRGGGGLCVCVIGFVWDVYIFSFPPSPFPLFSFISLFPSLVFSFFPVFFIYSYLCLGEWCAPESEEEFPG